MANDWLWHSKLSEAEVKKILKDSEHAKFVYYAALLLSRFNSPKLVFEDYLNSEDFCWQWPKIKRRMRKDRRNHNRVIFWNAIYLHLLAKFREEGKEFKQGKESAASLTSLQYQVGRLIKELRRESEMTQGELSKKSGVPQQAISNIERGLANPSLKTLDKLNRCLKRGIGVRKESTSQMKISAENLGEGGIVEA